MFSLRQKKLMSVFLSLAVAGTMLSVVPAAAAPADIGVSYQVHGQTYGWNQSAMTNGETAGTTGRSKRLEAIIISLTGKDLPDGASIIYQVHGQSYGWSQPAKADGAIAGTTGKSKRLEAIKITLKNMPGYAVVYRVHQQSYGWSDWVMTENGTNISKAAVAGQTGKSKQLEAIEIKLVNTNRTANVSSADELAAALADPHVNVINFKNSLKANPTVTRPLTINFGEYVLDGDVTFNYTDKGESVLTGDSDTRILGSLTVNTPNASFKNGVRVGGKVNIKNVAYGTWTESANGNSLTVDDPDGAVITVTGKPFSVTVTSNVKGNLTLNVNENAVLQNIIANAKTYIVVSPGATVYNINTMTGSNGSTIADNGNILNINAYSSVTLIANEVPQNIIAAGSGSIKVTGKKSDLVNASIYR